MADEEKEVIVSDNQKGNPNHEPAGSPKGGQFTSGPKSGDKVVTNKEKSASDDDSLGPISLEKEKPQANLITPEMIKNFVGKKNDIKTKEAINFINSCWEQVEPEMQQYYDGLDRASRIDLLKKSPQGYSEIYLKFATDEQLKALLVAESMLNKPIQLEQQLELANLKKKNLDEKINQETLLGFNEKYPEKVTSLSGVWYGTVGIDDYFAKSQIDNGETSPIDRKQAYYQEIINNPDASMTEKANAWSKQKQLNDWISACEGYLEIKSGIINKYADDVVQLENKIGALTKIKNEFSNNSPIVLQSQEYIIKFQDKNAAYSKIRKDNATWISPKWLKTHPGFYGDMSSVSVQYFGPKFEKMWNNMTPAERSVLVNYTGAGFSKFNRPLRGLSHGGWSGWDFATNVTNLTNAINKCVWDEDIWVQRGMGDERIFQLPGEATTKTLYEIANSGKLDSLVGTVFKDKGFYSAGAAKGTGMLRTVIFNTYCPKGTKMAYMNTKGTYAHTDENEMILQRGYSYRITKAEYKNGHYYIDCEVILGSDADNITDMNELRKIGKQHLG